MRRTRSSSTCTTASDQTARTKRKPPLSGRLFYGASASPQSAVDRPRPAIIIDGDENIGAFRHLDFFRIQLARNDGGQLDGDRGASDPLDLAIDADDIANLDRLVKCHRLHGHRHHPSLRSPRCEDPAGDIHLGQHPTAKDVPAVVTVAWHRGRPDDGVTELGFHDLWTSFSLCYSAITYTVYARRAT